MTTSIRVQNRKGGYLVTITSPDIAGDASLWFDAPHIQKTQKSSIGLTWGEENG